MTAALITLLRTEELQAITISGLCDAAGVHRTTFYGHYADIFEFAADVFTHLVDDLVAAGAGADDPPCAMLEHMLDHRPVYRMAFHTSIDVGVRRHLHARLVDQVRSTVDGELVATFVAGGLAAALEAWAVGDRVDVAVYATATAGMISALASGPSG